MSLLTTSSLEKSYGVQDLFTGVTVSISARGRIAMVGPNGIGKTTLLRILIGEESPTAGRLQRARGLQIGYLPQESAFTSQSSLWDTCLQAFANLLEIQKELHRLETAMQDAKQAEAALEQYGMLQTQFEQGGGYMYEIRIKQILTGLGFTAEDFSRPFTQLSGGQRTRAHLARLLLEAPDLLVLDEPTNHLDLAAVEWLEAYLRDYSGAVLLVSHDRYFINRVAQTIWELSTAGIEVYRGNYDGYLTHREERWAERRQNFQDELNRLAKEMDYIRRNIAGQNTSQAKGKLRRLSRHIEALEKGGIRAVTSKSWARLSSDLELKGRMLTVDEAMRRLSALHMVDPQPLTPKLRLKGSGRSGDLVIRTRDLKIGYADEGRPLFSAPDLTLLRGECAALIGPNGAGKTTFLKTLLEQIPPLGGEVIMGASLQIGYFAQVHESLHPEKTLLDEIWMAAPQMKVPQIRNYLAQYLFSGDDVYKKISTLSGGERSRLALAILALSGANLLLLDEPSNHLDLPAQETLQNVLADFSGTILLVSHDRYLIDALATQIWEISPLQASLQLFSGTYSRFHDWKESQRGQVEQKTSQRSNPAEISRKEHRQRQNTQRRHLAALAALEEQITELEKQLNRLAKQLEKPPSDLTLVQQLGEEYTRVQSELHLLYAEWERLSQHAYSTPT